MAKRLIRKGLAISSAMTHRAAQTLRGVARKLDNKRIDARTAKTLLLGFMSAARSQNAALMSRLDSKMKVAVKKAPFATKKEVAALKTKLAKLEKKAKKKR